MAAEEQEFYIKCKKTGKMILWKPLTEEENLENEKLSLAEHWGTNKSTHFGLPNELYDMPKDQLLIEIKAILYWSLLHNNNKSSPNMVINMILGYVTKVDQELQEVKNMIIQQQSLSESEDNK